MLPQHILVPIACEHLVVGLTRKEADTMALRGYKNRKSGAAFFHLILTLSEKRLCHQVAMLTPSISNVVDLIIFSGPP